jgi:hypothetical protein
MTNEKFYSLLSTCFERHMGFRNKRDIRARGLSDCVEGSWKKLKSRLSYVKETWISASDGGRNCCRDIFFIYFNRNYLYY